LKGGILTVHSQLLPDLQVCLWTRQACLLPRKCVELPKGQSEKKNEESVIIEARRISPKSQLNQLENWCGNRNTFAINCTYVNRISNNDPVDIRLDCELSPR
jgi:hypothetical protein